MPENHDEILLAELSKYQPANKLEFQHHRQLLEFLKTGTNHYRRDNQVGHVVGGALLLSPDLKKTLFTHHKKLNKWIQLGGHADGESNILNVAIREATEESGIADIKPFNSSIFDIDVHQIPENKKKNEPSHRHYEIRYILVAPTVDYQVSPESNDLKWFDINDIEKHQWDEAIIRMIDKWKTMLTKI